MKRRDFVKCVSVAGAALAAMCLSAIGEDGLCHTASGNKDRSPANRCSGNPENAQMLCEVKQYNGKPTLFVNGKPYFPMAYRSYFPKQFRYRNMRESGIRFFSPSITLGDGWYGAYRNGKVRLDKKGIWDAPGKIDFDTLDKSIQEILAVAPDAFIFPRIYCDAPSWWSSFHPAETNRTYNGLPMRQSFSSLVWREETAEVLRKIVHHIRQAPYAAHVIGLHVTAGETEESCHYEWLGPSDYSLAAQKRFKEWLLRRYHDESNVKRHLGKPLSEITIPSPHERARTDCGDFLDPVTSRLVVDYNTFRGEEILISLEYLCRAIKGESGGKLLTGVFYGYCLLSHWRDHSALSQALKSPYIDFFSNTNGAGRGTVIGAHDMHFLSATDSIQEAGKLFYYEADTRTSMSKWISELRPEIDPYHEYDTVGWLGPETMERTLELLKAVFSRVICTGSAHWWFDLWGGWYDHERILELFREMQKVGDESLHLPRKSVAQVCVIVDDKSRLYYGLGRNVNAWVPAQLNEIGRIGAPYDVRLIDDLNHVDVSQYRLLIFLDTILLTQHNLQILRKKCMNRGRTLLWLYAPGLIRDKLAVANVSEVVNMKVSSVEEHAGSKVTVEVGTKNLNYQGVRLSPFLYVEKGADKIYGKSEEGHAVLVVKNGPDSVTVFACVPPLPWEVLQDFAREAGVHIYSDAGDVVYANESYVAVCVARDGSRTIRFPRKVELQELLGKGECHQSAAEHEVDFTGQSCKLFRVIPSMK